MGTAGAKVKKQMILMPGPLFIIIRELKYTRRG